MISPRIQKFIDSNAQQQQKRGSAQSFQSVQGQLRTRLAPQKIQDNENESGYAQQRFQQQNNVNTKPKLLQQQQGMASQRAVPKQLQQNFFQIQQEMLETIKNAPQSSQSSLISLAQASRSTRNLSEEHAQQLKQQHPDTIVKVSPEGKQEVFQQSSGGAVQKQAQWYQGATKSRSTHFNSNNTTAQGGDQTDSSAAEYKVTAKLNINYAQRVQQQQQHHHRTLRRSGSSNDVQQLQSSFASGGNTSLHNSVAALASSSTINSGGKQMQQQFDLKQSVAQKVRAGIEKQQAFGQMRQQGAVMHEQNKFFIRKYIENSGAANGSGGGAASTAAANRTAAVLAANRSVEVTIEQLNIVRPDSSRIVRKGAAAASPAMNNFTNAVAQRVTPSSSNYNVIGIEVPESSQNQVSQVIAKKSANLQSSQQLQQPPKQQQQAQQQQQSSSLSSQPQPSQSVILLQQKLELERSMQNKWDQSKKSHLAVRGGQGLAVESMPPSFDIKQGSLIVEAAPQRSGKAQCAQQQSQQQMQQGAVVPQQQSASKTEEQQALILFKEVFALQEKSVILKKLRTDADLLDTWDPANGDYARASWRLLEIFEALLFRREAYTGDIFYINQRYLDVLCQKIFNLLKSYRIAPPFCVEFSEHFRCHLETISIKQGEVRELLGSRKQIAYLLHDVLIGERQLSPAHNIHSSSSSNNNNTATSNPTIEKEDAEDLETLQDDLFQLPVSYLLMDKFEELDQLMELQNVEIGLIELARLKFRVWEALRRCEKSANQQVQSGKRAAPAKALQERNLQITMLILQKIENFKMFYFSDYFRLAPERTTLACNSFLKGHGSGETLKSVNRAYLSGLLQTAMQYTSMEVGRDEVERQAIKLKVTIDEPFVEALAEQVQAHLPADLEKPQWFAQHVTYRLRKLADLLRTKSTDTPAEQQQQQQQPSAAFKQLQALQSQVKDATALRYLREMDQAQSSDQSLDILCVFDFLALSESPESQ